MEVHEVREVSGVRWFASEGAARAYVAVFREAMGTKTWVAAIEVPTTPEGICRLITPA